MEASASAGSRPRTSPASTQAAVSYRYADSNPVRELPSAQRPRPERKEAAYFENHELPRLFEHFRSEPVRTLCLVALKTGMRQGELFALRWADVTLKRRSFAFALAIRAAHLARQRTVSEGTSISFPTWSSSSHVCVTVARTKTSCFPARTVRDSSHRPLCSGVTSTLQ